MNIQQLKYFKAACQYQNISKAAQSLNVSQSSVTVAIKSIENEFGINLIKRQRVGFVLTPDGEDFLILVDGLIEHFDRVEGIMENKRGRHKPIRFGIPPMTFAIFLPTLFTDIEKEYPQIKLSFSEAGGRELLRLLDENVLDMAFVPGNDSAIYEGFESVSIARFEDVCCVSKNNPLAKLSSVPVDDLKKQPMVFFSGTFYHNDRMMMLFEEKKIKPNIICRTTQLSTMEQMISNDYAIGFLFKERAEQLTDIKWLSLEPKIYTKITLVWKKNAYFTDDMKLLIDFFKRNTL